MTNITSVVYYPVGLALFVLEGWVLSHILRFHAAAHVAELKSNRQAPLDGLRGLLALGVFFTHVMSYYFFRGSRVWDFPPCNWGAQLAIAPVSMFFFITGYLFWSKLRTTPRIPKARFWVGRVARLLPVYLFSCSAAFLLAACLSGFVLRVPPGTLAVEMLSWIANVQMVDLNSVANSHLWLVQAWTLRFEWMFYFTLPFLGWFARRLRNTLLVLCIAGVLAAIGQMVLGTAGGPDFLRFVNTFLHFFLHSFSLGILLASLPLERFSRLAKGPAATVASLLLVGCVLFLVPPRYGFLETSVLAVPFACICMGNTWWGFLSSRAMRFLGRISYSFYLLHLLSFNLIVMLAIKCGFRADGHPLQYWLVSFGAGMVIIGICAFSYQWLEHPFLHVREIWNPFAVAKHKLSKKA